GSGRRRRLGGALRPAQPGGRRSRLPRQPAASGPGVSTVSTTLAVTVARRPSALARLLRRPSAAAAVAAVAAFVVVALAAPWLAPVHPLATRFRAVPHAPAGPHPRGTRAARPAVRARPGLGPR